MIYLASPYSHPDPLIRKTRFLLAQQVTGILLKRKIWVYSPIVHCHEIVEKFSLPGDAAFWKEFNIDFLRRAEGMFILTIDGWEESKGIQQERDFAREAGIMLSYVNEVGEIH